MTTRVKSYRINITDDVQEGDAIVIGQNGGMVSCHLGTAAALDNGTNPGNVPILDVNGKLPDSTSPSSTMKKCVYDPNNKEADVYDYCNLDNTPEIPVVNDPTVTFTQGGVTVGSISLNQSGPTTIGLLAGGVTAGSAIDINNNEVSVDYDNTSIGVNSCDKLEVKDYATIVSGAAAGATAVQADDLATVAMTGNYCDLINKPEIPSAQIQSDWGQTNTNLPDYIKNKPTIGNATITLQKNGTNVDCFELNQTANKCINLTLSKGDVGLANVDNTADIDKPISTATQTALNYKQDNITDLNTIRTNASCGKCAYDTIGNYGDIVSHNVCEFATATQGGKADTAVQPGDLAAVATSGKYCDLSGQPTIPTDNCQLANSCGYTTCTGTLVASDLNPYAKTCILCSVATSGKYCDLTGKPTIPTDNCQLSNGCGYTTCTGTLVSSDLNPYAKCCDLKTVATSGQYCDLSGKPTIPTVINTLNSSCTTEALSAKQGCVLNSSITNINGKIPSAATTENQLADKAFVNSSINAVAAYYITKDVQGDQFATKAELDAATVYYSGGEVRTPTRNDYTIVASDETHDNATTRYSYNNGWEYQYTINETPLTQAQLNALNSGITSGKVSSYDSAVTTVNSLCTVATSGKYCDLTGIPTLCTVATSGKYCDLSGLPTIPTNNNQLTNGCGYTTCTGTLVASDLNPYAKTCTLCTVATTGKYCDLTGKPTIPTDNCQLANSCGYTTCTGTLVSSDLAPYAKSCDLKAVATSGKYCDLTGTPSLATVATSGCYNDLTGKPSLCTIATSGKYCDLSGTPSLATVATSGCYNDLTGKPTIPTDNCQLSNGCNYITKSVNNLDNYTPTTSLATVATSGAYCDLTGKPTLACVATSGCYDDLSGKPNLGVYQTTANMVCTLANADDSHYPSAKAVADALSCAGAGDMLSSVYDPCNKNANAFDYNNFINKPSLCAVATSGKYCDLTGTPTIPAALSAGKGISIDSNKINAQNLFVINEDAYDVTYTGELGVAPYNTCYCYTNVCINPNCGIQWIEGAQYMFNIDTKASNSACRNVRLKIGNGDYIPLMGTTSAVNGNSYFTKGAIRPFQYTTKYESCGALHTVSDSNTTYSAMSCSEGSTGTCTCARTLTATCLKAITQKHISDNAILKTSTGNQTVCTTASGCTTPLSLKSNAAGSSYIAFNTKDCFVGSIGVNCQKQPVFYNGNSYTLAYTTDIPTDNCQLVNGCGYLTSSSICPVATSGKYCDLTGTPDLSCKQDTLVLGTNLHYDGDGKLQVGDANNDIQGMRYVCTSYLKTSSGNMTGAPTAIPVLDASGWMCKQTPSCFLANLGIKTVATSGCYCDLTGTPTIPTDNCQLANSCGYTTCTGTLTNSSLKTVNGCCLIGSGDICIQGGVTSVNNKTGAVTVNEVPSTGTTGHYLKKTASGYEFAAVSASGGDMCYADFNWSAKSGNSITLSLNSTITPTANFTVNKPSTIKQGQAYVLRVTSGATPYTMSLGTCVINPFGEDLTLTANGTDQFIFLATSSSTLELQKSSENENVFVTWDEYTCLPSSKCTDGKTYFIISN